MAFVSTFTPSLAAGASLSATCSPFAHSVLPARRARTVRTSPTAHPRPRAPFTPTAQQTSPSSSTSPPPPPPESNGSGADVQAYESETPTEVVLDENIAGFCSIDPNTGKRLELTTREKESLFLDAMQSYFSGKSILSNEEFDMLKEELTWQGSEVVTLSRDEFKFLDAAKAYEQGKPSIPDEEFDALKSKLFEQGSVVAIARGPRCSIERKITFSDIIPDKKRTLALYVPAGLVFALTWLSFAYEFTPLHQVDPVLSLVIGSPVIVILAKIITGFIVPNAEIMVGDCPSCGRRTHVLFGDVLNQKGFNSEANVKCDKCKAQLRVERETSRMILVKEG